MPNRAPWTVPRRVHLQHGAQRRDRATRGRASPTIRVAIVDDHPALHTGLATILAGDPEMRHVGTADGDEDLWPLLRRAIPDVVLVSSGDRPAEAIHLCLSIAAQTRGPRAVLYGPSSEDGAAVVAASLAGVSGVVASASPASKLLATVRVAARLPQSTPPVSLRMKREAAAMLDPADHAILAMRLAGEPAAAIGDTLGVPATMVWDRLSEMIDRLETAGVAA